MNKTLINFGYNSNKIILRELNIQPNSKYHDDSKKILKKEYFISTKDIPSSSTTQLYEIDLFKAQLLELIELKTRINQLELMKYNIKEKEIIEQKEEEKQISNSKSRYYRSN